MQPTADVLACVREVLTEIGCATAPQPLPLLEEHWRALVEQLLAHTGADDGGAFKRLLELVAQLRKRDEHRGPPLLLVRQEGRPARYEPADYQLGPDEVVVQRTDGRVRPSPVARAAWQDARPRAWNVLRRLLPPAEGGVASPPPPPPVHVTLHVPGPARHAPGVQGGGGSLTPTPCRDAATSLEPLGLQGRGGAATTPAAEPQQADDGSEAAAASAPRRVECVIQRIAPDKATVTEGGTVKHVRGPKLVPLLLTVAVDNAGRHLAWDELVKADVANAAEVTARRQDRHQGRIHRRGIRTPKMATSAETLMRNGNRIKQALGKLAYHWHQDRNGVVWSPACE